MALKKNTFLTRCFANQKGLLLLGAGVSTDIIPPTKLLIKKEVLKAYCQSLSFPIGTPRLLASRADGSLRRQLDLCVNEISSSFHHEPWYNSEPRPGYYRQKLQYLPGNFALSYIAHIIAKPNFCNAVSSNYSPFLGFHPSTFVTTNLDGLTEPLKKMHSVIEINAHSLGV